MEPDEGIILQGAQRILRGEVLYRDFFSFLTPGSYYLLAFLFKIFGSSILVARTALVLLGAIYSVITYLLARRVCSRATAAFVAAIVTLTTLPYRFLVLHNCDSTLWA
jgi:4-amino-4-deoxy-L-arabinose transferase-like glycosyltransferase